MSVPVKGGYYTHYKRPDRMYTVVEVGPHRTTGVETVIYQALYNASYRFHSRDVSDWMSPTEDGGERFVQCLAPEY